MNRYTTETAKRIRNHFPALKRRENNRDVVYFDGPAGTQVPRRVADAMSRYLLECNANHGGLYELSRESDQLLDETHQAVADLVGTDDPGEILFGQNMTSLTFALSRALSRTWQSGDEIIVTRLDHDANISPWVLAARDTGVTVHRLPFRETDCTLDLDELRRLINGKTRLVAVGCASNASGGINPVQEIGELAHQHGAEVFLDAVHYGPHGLIDVQQWNCDYLACSAYKFFGPHIGMIWGRRALLEKTEAYRVRPAGDELPGKWMTGTQSHESMAGTLACIDYLADLGRELAAPQSLPSRRDALAKAFAAIGQYERELSRHLIEGLNAISGIRIYGISDTSRLAERFPTVSITHEQIPTTELARILAAEGINVWNGNYYALEFSEQLGLEPEGMVRIGLVHYNLPEEIDRLLNVIQSAAVAAIH